MKGKQLGPLALILVATLIATADARAQSNDPGASLLSTRIPIIAIRNGIVLDVLVQLSDQSTGLSFSFEDVLRAKFGDPPSPLVRFDLNLGNTAVSDVLDELCARDRRFAWQRDGLTVNIYPRATEGESSYVMNRHLPQLELRSIKDAGEAAFAIVGQLPPPFEQIAIAQSGGDISYASPWTGSLRSLTVRQALNLAARQIAPRGGWIFSGANDFRTIGFYTGRLHYSSQE